jgi:hypothetical protein
MVSTWWLAIWCFVVSACKGDETTDEEIERVCLAAMSSVVAQMKPKDRLEFQARFEDPEAKALTKDQQRVMFSVLREYPQEILQLADFDKSCVAHLHSVERFGADDGSPKSNAKNNVEVRADESEDVAQNFLQLREEGPVQHDQSSSGERPGDLASTKNKQANAGQSSSSGGPKKKPDSKEGKAMNGFWWEEEALVWFFLLGFSGLVFLLFAKLGWLKRARVRKFTDAMRELRSKHFPKERAY